ncbi:beta-barrel assembly-enhancing protease [Pseudosulfitobacter pseudonitzschiae]|uniref:Beta-barrel assembly-enhancing protease n=2 Tax=Rhodobacterales TaxID=204455 RepID=A0A221JWY9_9RHOB|nr:beta-barrel assembly-enhancing protease [Pseudosulfitobacter pseudonitzschiae]
MLKKLVQVLLPLAMLAACDVPTVSGPAPQTTAQNVRAASFDELRNSDQAERAFVQVVQRLEPVAERECRNRTTGVNCDFRIVVDDRPNQPANAYQTLDKSNRPVIFFTLKLIQEAYNADEIAFVMGHESAHHIAGHIARQRQNAVAGAVIFAGLATLTGGDAGAVESAQRLGEQVGARSYSKEFELEADALGTVITYRAGYDPLRGAEFFRRIPDPGNRFLGTHPPNTARMEIVRRTAAAL